MNESRDVAALYSHFEEDGSIRAGSHRIKPSEFLRANLSRKKLEIVDKAEQYLLDLGFKQVRVRYHDEIARIEVSSEERKNFFDEDLMDKVYKEFNKIGFNYVTLDLKGYRTGSMNETIIKE